MDDKTAALLQSLADKLGTTSEYLWRVLIKQAPVEGIISLVQIGIICGAICTFIVLMRKWLKSGPDADAYFPTAIVFGVIGGIGGLIAITMLGDVVTAFANPEYWALHEVLHAVKSK